jgi:hypothetical protein
MEVLERTIWIGLRSAKARKHGMQQLFFWNFWALSDSNSL